MIHSGDGSMPISHFSTSFVLFKFKSTCQNDSCKDRGIGNDDVDVDVILSSSSSLSSKLFLITLTFSLIDPVVP